MKYKTPFLTLYLLLALGSTALADYRFELPRNVSWVTINPSGQADLYYSLTFTCLPQGQAIDIVDIGLPNGSYQLESARASIRGRTLSDIRVSEYVKPYGVEVHLDGMSIAPGDSGTLEFWVHLTSMLNQDSQDEAYASFKFSPTWYGSEYVSGSTYLECNFVFPPGVQADEPRYHENEFTEAWYDTVDNTPVYRWVMGTANPDEQYTFGASFPAKYVSPGAVTKPAPLLFRIIGGFFGFLWGIVKFFLNSFVFWMFGAIIFFGVRNARKRRMKYLPPEVSVEGVGIKRGLTAPEAGLLLEMPLDKVLTMILFGLIKKGALEVSSRSPQLKFKLLDAVPADQPYEKTFLASLDKQGLAPEAKLQALVIDLIKETNAKMKGFSRKETVAYYKSIVSQAWQQVTAAQTPELKTKELEEQFDWMSMDPAYNDRMRSQYGTGDVYLPRWWGRWGYGGGQTTTGGGGSVGKGPSMEMPKLPGADFANRMTTGMEGFAAGLVGKVDSFTGKITDKTNPIPVSSGSGRSSGGGGCACACACAGCACACAGGGR
jgi:hypothetical protein